MSPRAQERLRRWGLFAAAVVFVASTLDLAFELSLFLQSRGYLWKTVRTLFLASVAVTGYVLWFDLRIRSPGRLAAILAALAVFAGAMVTTRDRPAERFHFLEYGLIALLAWRAARLDFAPKAAVPLAFGAAAAAGLFDEWLQGLSAVRYFDWRDVRTNALAALLAVAIAWCAHALRPRETAGPVPEDAHGDAGRPLDS